MASKKSKASTLEPAIKGGLIPANASQKELDDFYDELREEARKAGFDVPED